MAIREVPASDGETNRDQGLLGGLIPEGTTIVDRYTILGVLGRGGMSTVYRARDRRLDRLVALKVLDTSAVDAAASAAREDRLTAALAHPNIVTVYDSGITPTGQPFLVLELLDGLPAAQLAPLPPDRALAIAEQIARALEHAHLRGIVHCDVKPQNIVVDDTARAVLTDFGVASPESAPTGETVYGSAPYLAPERLRGAAASPTADLYALGASLYFLLTGRPPYADSGDTAARVLESPPLPLSLIAPGLPAPVIAIVERAMATDPDERFPNAESLRCALAAAHSAITRPQSRLTQLAALSAPICARFGTAARSGGRMLLLPRTARLGLVTFIALALLVAIVLPRPRIAVVAGDVGTEVSEKTAEIELALPVESHSAGDPAALRSVPYAPSASPAAVQSSTGPIHVVAAISDTAPGRSARLTITGQLLRGDVGIVGVPMQTRWHFRSGTAACDQRNGTDEEGRASCTFSMSGATSGREVVVDVVFDYEGQTYQTQVQFTPQ